MSELSDRAGRPLRVIQCFRAPLGGLFRHVCDLTHGLAERGVEVGVICDSGAYGDLQHARLGALEQVCALGVHRTPMARGPSLFDLSAVMELRRLASRYDADILHGHGAKGGAYARLAAWLGDPRAVYTTHGGSLHYRWTTPGGFAYLALERALRGLAQAIVFESRYVERVFRDRIGEPPALSRVVHNGLVASEFAPVQHNENAADVLFIGEFRTLKGPFVLIDALARLANEGTPLTAVFIGRGSEEDALRASVPAVLADRISFCPPMPARDAFARARLVVIPSLAESLPYIVLEAGGAGVPLVATNVGGIPEIFGPLADLALIAPGDPAALAVAIKSALENPETTLLQARRLRDHVISRFSVDVMVDGILDAYRSVLAPLKLPAAPVLPHRPA